MPDPSLQLEWISATIPKIGNQAEENEDAIAAAPDVLRFVVSDGASEGWESGSWANALTSAFIRTPPAPTDFPQWLAKTRKGWSPRPIPEPAPWYALMKQEQGAFATMLGLELRRSRTSGWAWRAVAVGDSCLFHVRGGKVKSAFPLTSPKQFGSTPPLIANLDTIDCPEPEWLAGRADAGDVFFLASDAASARLLDPDVRTAALAAVSESLQSRDAAALVSWCRTVQSTTNDDVSIIAIRLPSNSKPKPTSDKT